MRKPWTVPFHTIDEHIYFNHIFPSNSLYSIDKKHVEITKRIELDFGEYNFKIDDLPKNRKNEYYRKFMLDNKDKHAFIVNIAENNKILFVHFFLNDKTYVAKVNKTTKESTIFYNVLGSIEQFPTVNLMKDDVLTYVCEPGYLKYYVSDKLLDSTSRKIISNVNNSDNPYVIRYTLKKNNESAPLTSKTGLVQIKGKH